MILETVYYFIAILHISRTDSLVLALAKKHPLWQNAASCMPEITGNVCSFPPAHSLRPNTKLDYCIEKSKEFTKLCKYDTIKE